MTQIVNPSIDRVADSFLTAGSLAYAGLNEGGIVPSGQQTELAKQSAADETVLNGFKAVMNLTTDGSPTPDFTVSAGEAFIFGAWVIKDSITQLTAPTNSIITIYVGWDKDSANNVIVGQESDFSNQDSKVPIAEVTSNADGVTDISDIREFVSIHAERLEGKDTSEITPDISDDGATVVENVDDINVEGFSASNDGDGSATIVGPAQYTDSDAISAVNNESSLSVNISGDANSVNGFSFVKDGNSGPGIINYQAGIEATGGTTVIDRTISGVDYRIHAFESVGSSTFSVNQAPPDGSVDVLVVGGGGGAGDNKAGGGGGGGVVFNEDITVNTGSFTVNVGDGGAGVDNDTSPANSGANSSFDSIIAEGGGGGASDLNNTARPGGDGASGGGGVRGGAGGSGITGQGNDGGAGSNNANGYAGGGGGGASQVGQDGSGSKGGDGGDGLDFSSEFSSQFGENGFFGGGGGGMTYVGGIEVDNPGDGGIGGGAAGSQDLSINGDANTGGGGGGTDSGATTTGGDGGSGIVLIRYEI